MYTPLAMSFYEVGTTFFVMGLLIAVGSLVGGTYILAANRSFEFPIVVLMIFGMVIGTMLASSGQDYRQLEVDRAATKKKVIAYLDAADRQRIKDKRTYTRDVKAACRTEVSEQFRFYISQADYDSWKIARDTVIGQCKATGGKAVVPDPSN